MEQNLGTTTSFGTNNMSIVSCPGSSKLLTTVNLQQKGAGTETGT